MSWIPVDDEGDISLRSDNCMNTVKIDLLIVVALVSPSMVYEWSNYYTNILVHGIIHGINSL